jgi:hypothetical protein
MIKSSFVYITIIIKKRYKLYKLYPNIFVDKTSSQDTVLVWVKRKNKFFQKIKKGLKKVVIQSFQA